jgi:chromosome partitioning protein
VVLLDTDSQRSACIWHEKMKESYPSGVTWSLQASTVPQEIWTNIKQLKSQFDYVLIDTPASNGEICRTVADKSDAILVPVVPSGLDYDALNNTVLRIRQSMEMREELDGGPKGFFFLSRVPSSWKVLVDDGRRVLQSRFKGFKTLDTKIGEYVSIADAPIQGLTVFDMDNADKAIAAYTNLFEEVERKW